MAKNDHAHALRLWESIRVHAGADEADALATMYPLSKSAGVEKKMAWAQQVCAYLDDRFDENDVISIRKDCKCNDGKSIAAKIQRYLSSAGSIRQMVEDFNAGETFAQMVYLSDRKLLFCYPQCYCACIKRAEGSVPQSWCYCTLGNAQSIFRQVFPQENISVALLESIKTGGKRCVIRVEW